MNRQFPIIPVLGAKYGNPKRPRSIPWDVLAPHEQQARRNHSQSLEELAYRGGLTPCEVCAVLEGRKWHRMDETEAITRMAELVAASARKDDGNG